MYIHMSKRIWWEDIRQKNGFITLVSANFIPVSVGAPERGRIHKHYFCHNFQVQRRHTTQTRGIWVDTGRNFYRDIRRETARHSFRACKIHSRTSFNLDLNIFFRFTVSAKNGSLAGWLELIMMYSSTYVTVYIIINISSKCLPEKKIVRYVFLINGFNFPFDFFVSQVLAFLERLLLACD